MPITSLWGLVISLAVLALGLVYKVVENSHALKLADKEADRLRSRLEALEKARENESLRINSEAATLNNADNNCISKSGENQLITINEKRNEPKQEVHINSAPIPSVPQREVSNKISSLSEALSLEAVLKCLDDKDSTPLQKSIFVERNTGSRITWRGRVESVQKAWEREKDSDLIIVISSPNDSNNFRKFATATFPSPEIHSLAQAKSGDIILFEGTLNFNELAGNWSTSLKDSRFIRFEKNA